MIFSTIRSLQSLSMVAYRKENLLYYPGACQPVSFWQKQRFGGKEKQFTTPYPTALTFDPL